MAPVLYMIPYSQPVRAVLMLIKALGINVQLKEVNLIEKQQLSPEYLKINPQHSVPTLDDNGFIIWDSHAIMPYLIATYGHDDTYYPEDLKLRTVVNQRLHFESGILFPRTMDLLRPIIYDGVTTLKDELVEKIQESYKFLEQFLDGLQWVAPSKTPTIADFSIIASITTMDLLVPIDAANYPNIRSWIKRMESLPCYQPNQIGVDMVRETLKQKLGAGSKL